MKTEFLTPDQRSEVNRRLNEIGIAFMNLSEKYTGRDDELLCLIGAYNTSLKNLIKEMEAQRAK